MRCCVDEVWEVPPSAVSLPLAGAAVLLQQARGEGLDVVGIGGGEAGWAPCAPEELLDDAVEAWITQRPGCAGPRSSVVFVRGGERRGAWIADARPGRPEPAAWRTLLVQALVRAARAA